MAIGNRQGILSTKRFLYPVTPTGRASLLDLCTEPSHRIAVSSLTIGFEADPDVVRQYVPEPLELDGSGLVFLKTSSNTFFNNRQTEEFISYERLNFSESFFWIPCDYQGERYHFMPFSWTNRDWLAFLGRQVGQPHKLGRVEMTQFHIADPVYYGPNEGVRLCISVDNGMGLVLRGHCDLRRPIEVEEMPFRISDDYCPRFLGHRYVWDVTTNKPAFDDLVVHWGDDIKITGSPWYGDASLTFFDTENEEVLAFQPRRVRGGWYMTFWFNHSTSTPQVLHRFDR